MQRFASDYAWETTFTTDAGDIEVEMHFEFIDSRDPHVGLVLMGFYIGALRVDREMAIMLNSLHYVQQVEDVALERWQEHDAQWAAE